MDEKRQLIITNQMDLVTIFNGSAKEFNDPTWLNHLSAGGSHYYGDAAGLFAGFDGDGFIGNVQKDTVAPSAPKWGITWDIQKAMSQPWNNATPVTTDPVTQ